MFWELVRHQRGLITRDQARSLGWVDRQLATAVGNGRLELILPTVFRDRGAPRTRSQLVLAVSLWLGESGEIPGVTAGRLWRLDRVDASNVVTASSWTRRSPSALVHVRRRRLDEYEVTIRHGMRVTTAARTIIDLADGMSRARLESAVESTLRQRYCSLDELRGAAAASPTNAKGRGHLIDWLERRGDGPALESQLEQRTFDALRRAGIPAPARQHEVWVDGIGWAVDLSWPTVRVGIECDGFAARASRGLPPGPREARRTRLGGLVDPPGDLG